MKKRMFEMECPHCGHSFYIARDTLLLSPLSKEDKKHMGDGSFFMHQCQKCHRLFQMVYPLIYREPENNFSLVFSQEKDLNLEIPGYIVRVRKAEDFCFCWNILHYGLDLATCVRIKKQLEEKEGKKARLASVDKLGKILWFMIEEDLFGVRYDVENPDTQIR